MEKYWIWFKLLNIDLKKKLKILDYYKNIYDIYNIKKEKLIDIFELNKKEINIWYSNTYMKKAEEINKINKLKGINILTILDKDYPVLLKKISYPPILIYYLGNKEILNKNCITIFQGLHIDKSGIKLLKYLSKGLLENNIKIVSRFNKNDKYIYMNNIANEDNIVVLAGGFNDKIFLKNGIILTENEYNVKSTKENIIKRNRILTGISSNVILIQATIDDGVGYIVDNAIEQGKEITVFPSDIFNIKNTYTNELIKQGVNVITDYNELLVYEQNINM